MSKYRLYIDESGSHEYSDSVSIKRKYLGLLGVIIEVDEYESNIQPQVIELKKMFSTDPDELVVLHRDEIVNKQGAFSKLTDPGFESKFNEKLETLLNKSNYILCGVVLDKKIHLDRYKSTALHPYHYCLNVILERYVFFLEQVNASGDVMSESRGKKEDDALRGAYFNFYSNGTFFCGAPRVQRRLTSNKIKLRTKAKTAEGLEIADLLVLASKFLTLKMYEKIETLTDNFSKQIMKWVWEKYRRCPNSTVVKGFGLKLIE